MTLIDPALEARALAEHQLWVRDLEAERVTHSNESMPVLLARLRRELPESPDARRRRLWREEQRLVRELSRHQGEVGE